MMNKCFFFLISFLLFCFSISTSKAQTANFMVKAGIGWATILNSPQSDENGFKPESRLAAHLGVGIRKSYTDKIGVQGELLFLQQGANLAKDDSLTLNFNSAGLSALVFYKIVPALELEIGVQPTYTFSLKNNYDKDLSNVWTNWRFDGALLLGMRYLITDSFAIAPRIRYGVRPIKTNFFYTTDGVSYITVENRYNHFNAGISFEYIFGN
ncbi:hypothetical protein D770_13530 [Flammeovirgaceae bacterium 311]|nr:hypothetical protein D770_13530 [Flammeovirgaceae bacterium 311]